MRRLLVTLVATFAVVGTAAPAPAQDQDQQAPPVITLLDPGEGPRAPLRYELTPGGRQQSRLVLETRISQKSEGEPARSGSTGITFSVSTQVGVVNSEGITLTVSYDDLEVDDGPAQSQIEDALEPLIGVSMGVTMTDRGEIVGVTADVPTGLDETAESLFESFTQQARGLAVALPEEPVGEGARWTARTDATLAGITISQTARYELVRVSDERIVLKLKITQRAPRQTFEDPASGIEVELLSSRGSGAGTSTLDLGLPLPAASDTEIRLKQKLRAQGQSLSQTTTAIATFEPA